MVSVDVETHGVVQIFVAVKLKKPVNGLQFVTCIHILLPGDILKNKNFKKCLYINILL